MKKLTIKLRHRDIQPLLLKDIQSIQQNIHSQRPVWGPFVEFLNEYQGAKVVEYFFTDKRALAGVWDL
jgi:hypothetical protein